MKVLIFYAVAFIIGACTTTLACGPDGKCIGKDKAACCLSKSSAKKASCSFKHRESKVKQDVDAQKTSSTADASPQSTNAESTPQASTPKP